MIKQAVLFYLREFPQVIIWVLVNTSLTLITRLAIIQFVKKKPQKLWPICSFIILSSFLIVSTVYCQLYIVKTSQHSTVSFAISSKNKKQDHIVDNYLPHSKLYFLKAGVPHMTSYIGQIIQYVCVFLGYSFVLCRIDKKIGLGFVFLSILTFGVLILCVVLFKSYIQDQFTWQYKYREHVEELFTQFSFLKLANKIKHRLLICRGFMLKSLSYSISIAHVITLTSIILAIGTLILISYAHRKHKKNWLVLLLAIFDIYRMVNEFGPKTFSSLKYLYHDNRKYNVSNLNSNIFDKSVICEKIEHIHVCDVNLLLQQGQLYSRPFSYEFRKNNLYIVTGCNGIGKSSLLSVLGRKLSPDEGHICYNGNIVRGSDTLAYRVMYLEQNTGCVFSGALGYNLYLRSVGDISKYEPYGLLDFITEFPNGLEYMVGTCGRNLSGGQKQMIGIFQIFLQQPDVIILDEPSSALGEKYVTWLVENIKERIHDTIIIISTHDDHLLSLLYGVKFTEVNMNVVVE